MTETETDTALTPFLLFFNGPYDFRGVVVQARICPVLIPERVSLQQIVTLACPRKKGTSEELGRVRTAQVSREGLYSEGTASEFMPSDGRGGGIVEDRLGVEGKAWLIYRW